MSRILSILIALLVILGIYLMVSHAKDSYKILPIDEHEGAIKLEADPNSHYELWREFSPQSGDFKVLFPGVPQNATDKITDSKTKEVNKYDMYVAAKDNGTAFMISVVTFPREVSPSAEESTLTDIINEMIARNKNNNLKMMKPSTFHNHTSMDFAIENGEATIAGKVFMHNKTMYIISMIAKTTSFNQKDLDFFINSFSFENEQKSS